MNSGSACRTYFFSFSSTGPQMKTMHARRPQSARHMWRQGGPDHACLLALTEAVTNPNCALRHSTATGLLRETGHVMQIELRTDEQMLREKELHADTCMNLEMAGISYGL